MSMRVRMLFSLMQKFFKFRRFFFAFTKCQQCKVIVLNYRKQKQKKHSRKEQQQRREEESKRERAREERKERWETEEDIKYHAYLYVCGVHFQIINNYQENISQTLRWRPAIWKGVLLRYWHTYTHRHTHAHSNNVEYTTLFPFRWLLL